MKPKARKEQSQPVETLSNHPQEFNFESWAKEVRPLLLASLNKRGSRY